MTTQNLTTPNVHIPNKAGPTADLISYWREFSDIPFAKEISDVSNAKLAAEEIFKKSLPHLSPTEAIKVLNSISNIFGGTFIEGRYKSLDQQIEKIGIKHIYEVASGICPRAINQTYDPAVKYIASDLPERVDWNKTILQKVMENHKMSRQNLLFAPVNVLNREIFMNTSRLLLEGPIAFIHEGLLLYFNPDEKMILGENVKALLKKNGGVWITPDVVYRDVMQKRLDARPPDRKRMMQLCFSVLYGVSERSIFDNSFETESHADKFFDDLGFSVKKYSRHDGSFELTSLKYVPKAAVEEAIGVNKTGHVYVACLK